VSLQHECEVIVDRCILVCWIGSGISSTPDVMVIPPWLGFLN